MTELIPIAKLRPAPGPRNIGDCLGAGLRPSGAQGLLQPLLVTPLRRR